MKFNNFIEKLLDAGWINHYDADFVGIITMWEELFPVVAELEREIQALHNDLNE